MTNIKQKDVDTTKPTCTVLSEINATLLMVTRSWENQMIQSTRSNIKKLTNYSNISIAAVIIQDKNQNQEEVWWTTMAEWEEEDSFKEEVEVATLDMITTEVVTTTTPEVEVEVGLENNEDHIKDQETTKLSNANSLNKVSTNFRWI